MSEKLEGFLIELTDLMEKHDAEFKIDKNCECWTLEILVGVHPNVESFAFNSQFIEVSTIKDQLK